MCARGSGLGGGLDALGRWPSQAAEAAERVALPYATRFQLESAALVGLGAVGSGDPQARATPSPNAQKWRRSAASAVTDNSWSSRRYTTPMGGVIQKHVCPSHWDGDQALTCLDRSPAPSQGRSLTVVELVVPVPVSILLVEHGGILQDFGREGPKL